MFAPAPMSKLTWRANGVSPGQTAMPGSMIGEMSMRLMRVSYARDHFQLDVDRRRQRVDADGGPRRLHFREVLAVDAVEALEVALHVGEVDGDVEDLLDRAAGLLQDRLHVLDRSARLHFDVRPRH